MLLSADYNKLAWAIVRKYDIPLKWAMKSAYCLRDLELKEPMLWMTRPSSPLAEVWDPANAMMLVSVLRSQARLSPSRERSSMLHLAATDIYDKYSSLEGVGSEFVSKLLDGELVYWATKYYVDSLIAKKRGWSEESRGLAIEFSEGESYTTFWFDYSLS
jgi:hypothetical protein